MQMKPSVIAIFVASLAIAGGPNAMGLQPQKSTKILVEVWSGGDDGLTQRLKDSVERQFNESDDFQMSSGKKPKTLIVTIPSNVSWKQSGKRTRVFYKIDFTSIDGETLGRSSGNCLDDDLAKCSIHNFSDATIAARKIK